MSLATVTFRDKDGAIDVGLVFEGGFDPKSHAHQHAQAFLKMMDAHMPKIGEPTVTAMDKLHQMAAAENSVAERLTIVKG